MKSKKDYFTLRGVWVAQLVKHPTLAQVMISQFVGLRPTSGSMLMAQSLEPASYSVSPLPLPCSCSVSLALKNKQTFKKLKKKFMLPFALAQDSMF